MGRALLLVGHVTKEGVLGVRGLWSTFWYTVLSFEGDRYLLLRALRALKHRFGPTGETGLFEMGESGSTGVPDPSSLFLGDRLVGQACPGFSLAHSRWLSMLTRRGKPPDQLKSSVSAPRMIVIPASRNGDTNSSTP